MAGACTTASAQTARRPRGLGLDLEAALPRPAAPRPPALRRGCVPCPVLADPSAALSPLLGRLHLGEPSQEQEVVGDLEQPAGDEGPAEPAHAQEPAGEKWGDCRGKAPRHGRHAGGGRPLLRLDDGNEGCSRGGPLTVRPGVAAPRAGRVARATPSPASQVAWPSCLARTWCTLPTSTHGSWRAAVMRARRQPPREPRSAGTPAPRRHRTGVRSPRAPAPSPPGPRSLPSPQRVACVDIG